MDADFEAQPTEREVYFDERKKVYWMRNREGEWIWLQQPDLKRELIGQGMAKKADDGAPLSEVEEFIRDVTAERRVFYAGPLAGHKEGFFRAGGERFLITRSPELIEPVPPAEGAASIEDELCGGCVGWPVLGALLRGMLADADERVDQRPYFFGWLRHVMDSLYAGTWSRGLAVAAAGEPGSGKSLVFVDVLKVLLGGREAKPYEYMIGKDNFNEELCEAVLWSIDDENSDSRFDARMKVKAEIKKAVANGDLRIRGLHSRAITVRSTRRLVICLNLEPENLKVLPPIDEDLADKISLFKCYRREMPMPARTIAEQAAFWRTLMGELPCFVHWLLRGWKTADALLGRFGVTHWHHPEILQNLMELSPQMRTWQLIERIILSREWPNPEGGGYHVDYWQGTATDLEAALKRQYDEGPSLDRWEAKDVQSATYLGKDLKKLMDSPSVPPGSIDFKRTNSARIWTLRPASVAVKEGGGE